MMPRVISDKGKGESAIRPLAKTTRIGIVLYSGAKLAAVLGLTDSSRSRIVSVRSKAANIRRNS